jgi:serine/threonine protein kinase
MTDLAQFDRLFARWQDLCENDQSPTPAEVCADCPELTGEFQRRLQGMEALSDFLGVDAAAAEQDLESRDTSAETDGDTGHVDTGHRAAVASPQGTPAGLPSQAELSFLDPPDAPDCLGRLGPYRVLAVLGEGGMGIVLKAEEPLPRRLVAIKVVRPDLTTPHWRQRFLREGQALASVEHERVVPVYRVDVIRGMQFLVMPLLQGESLRDWLKARSGTAGPPAADAVRTSPFGPPLVEVLRIGREVAEGLAAAHAADLIHRDIKPSNIWLRGPDRRVVLIDFGLARTPLTQHEDQTELTSAGAVLGTAGYIAPEQAAGRAVDARADLFSLGCVLYELTTGRRPFTGSDPMAILSALANFVPPSPKKVQPDIPAALSALIMRLLAKSPDDRPRTASEVVAALRAIEQGGDDLAPTAELPIACSVGIPPAELRGVDVPPASGSRIGTPPATTGRADAAPASSRTFKLMVGCGGLLTVSITATAAVALMFWMDKPAAHRSVARLDPPKQQQAPSRAPETQEAPAPPLFIPSPAVETPGMDAPAPPAPSPSPSPSPPPSSAIDNASTDAMSPGPATANGKPPADGEPVKPPPSDMTPPTNPPTPAPDTPEPPPDEEMPDEKMPDEKQADPEESAAVSSALEAARTALAKRDLASAQDHLGEATQAASAPDTRAEVARVQALATYVEGFWNAVRQQLPKLEAGEELQIDGKTAVVVDANESLIVLRRGGNNEEHSFRRLPAKIAVYLARRWLAKGDPGTDVALAAFYLVEKNGDLDEAQRLLDSAQASGANVGLLADELAWRKKRRKSDQRD